MLMFESDSITRDMEDKAAAMSLWAGEGVSRIHRIQSTPDIVKVVSAKRKRS
jgi:hypothetical protein